MIRLLIVDDHPVVRTGLLGMLAGEADFEVVGEARDGQEAIDRAAVLDPDVVLMDPRMPDVDGVAATERIRARRSATHVLVLTTYDSDDDVLRAIDAGATRCLLKDAPREELFRAIRAAAQGHPVLAPAVLERVINRLRTPATDTLSEREVEVLQLVAGGAANKEVARELFIARRPSRPTSRTSSPSSVSTIARPPSRSPSTGESSATRGGRSRTCGAVDHTFRGASQGTA